GVGDGRHTSSTSDLNADVGSADLGNYESLAVNAAAVTTVLTDDVDTTTVSLTATAAAAEGGTITYTASVGAPVSGSAVNVVLDKDRKSVVAVEGGVQGVAVGVGGD